MKSQLLVTATGSDRPGIVARLTEVFVQHDANLEESRMALLGGEFAAIMLICLPQDQINSLAKSLDMLKTESIITQIKPTQASINKQSDYLLCQVTVSGADHEGIVHAISSYLHDRLINIQKMDTHVDNAPETGIPLFSMTAIIEIPSKITLSSLRQHLIELADRQSVDIEIKEIQNKALILPAV